MIADWNVAFQVFLGFHISVHVSAFGYDADADVWIIFDPHHSHTEVRALKPADFDQWVAGFAGPRLRGLVQVYRIPARRQTSVIFPGLWCVGAVKRLIGLRSGALSPGGLRRDLLRAGAQRVFAREGQDPRADA